MAIQNEPTRITIPFADSGTKNSIPDTQPSPSASQAASWTDGFPAQCSLPLSAGGIPPARADFNGIFNRITQSERFTQEGGVWLWSNAVDYAASRMVRGSDGTLYLSVAQSGPNVGGAVDPTTDNGTYWVKLPSMADIAAQNYATQGWVVSQNYATQAWINSLFATAVYVSPAGSDANDGMSMATAVQTFARAIDIAKLLPQKTISIIAASGSYAGDIIVNGLVCGISLQGNITVTGKITVTGSGTLLIGGDTYSLDLITSGAEPLTCADSYFWSNCRINISYGGDYWAIFANGSDVSFANNVSIVASNANKPESIIVTEGSRIVFGGSLTISGSGSDLRINIGQSSSGVFNGATISNSSNTGGSLYVNNSSSALLGQGVYELNGYGSDVIYASSCACIFVEMGSLDTFLMKHSDDSSGSCIRATQNSSIFITMAQGATLSLSAISSISCFILAELCSNIELAGFGTVNIGGTVNTQTVFSSQSSAVYFGSGLTIPNNTVTGVRFFVNLCSTVFTFGAGPYRIPGSTDGTADSSSFGVYA